MTTFLLTGLARTQNACSERARRISSSSRSAVIKIAGMTPLDLPDDRHGLKPRQTGHVHVHQREVDFVLPDQLDGLFTALGHQRSKALRRDDLAKRLPRGPIVIGDQN